MGLLTLNDLSGLERVNSAPSLQGWLAAFKEIYRPKPGVLAGIYEFRWPGGSLPARFTFVVGPQGILHHHSSAMP
jgi:hypothetical protein